MTLRVAELPDQDHLTNTVSPALADYRVWQKHVRPQQAFEKPLPVIRGAFTRWIIPRGADLAGTKSLAEVLTQGGRWHLHIHLKGKPRYYARVRHAEAEDGSPEWIVEWLGEKYVRPLQRGITFLESRADTLDGEVRVVASDLYQFTGFWVHPEGLFYIVTASSRLDGHLPLYELISADTLRTAILKAYGPSPAPVPA